MWLPNSEVLEDAIYRSLSRTEWREGLTVLREIRKQPGCANAPGAVVFLSMHRACEAGWAESRSVEVPVTPIYFEGRAVEYRLKDGGLRKPKKRRSFVGWLFPKLKEV